MFQHLKRRIVERLRMHHAIIRLGQLDDHLLADCGVPREHIPELVRGQLRRNDLFA